tara:strand:- start:976 stop:1179 length:204 start_codon:yes stop_codon:yes gene_type:complete
MYINEAQQATDERDQAMDEIHEWMSLRYTVAKLPCPINLTYLKTWALKQNNNTKDKITASKRINKFI